MYDFYFGTDNEIDGDPKKYLLTIKRMMPRWCNSIPDSEYLAIYDLLAEQKFPKNPVFVETGSGASTIVLCYFALKNDGELFTWDTNGSKLFYLRSIINDTLMTHFKDKNSVNHWKHVAFSSTSEFAGIHMLKELGKRVDACFLDSEHTSNTLLKELEYICELVGDSAVFAIDDGNYSYVKHNTAYINMIRKKYGLPPIAESADNLGKPFWQKVEAYLKNAFLDVKCVDDSYKKNYQNDLFWAYFRNDRDNMSKMAMEKTDDLVHRFDAWKVVGKK